MAATFHYKASKVLKWIVFKIELLFDNTNSYIQKHILFWNGWFHILERGNNIKVENQVHGETKVHCDRSDPLDCKVHGESIIHCDKHDHTVEGDQGEWKVIVKSEGSQ